MFVRMLKTLLLRENTITSLFILLANRGIRILDRIATPAGIRVGEVPIVAKARSEASNLAELPLTTNGGA